MPCRKDVARRFLHPQTLTILFFSLNFLYAIFSPPLLILLCFLWFSVFLVVPLCLKLQVPCNTPSPSSCFCFSNPCSCSQEKSRRDGSPAAVCWETRGGQSNLGLCGTVALRNTHTVNIWKQSKSYNQGNWVSVPLGLLTLLRSF